MRWRSPHRTPERLGPTARPSPALVPPYPPASWRPAGGTRASDGARGMPAAAPPAHGARRAGDGPLSRLAEAVARAGLLDSDALDQAAAACLEVLAEVVGARGQPELAARLVGAADTLRGPPAGVGAE